ncbi:MAG TPA: hypothetical protein VKV74_14590 [Bryobacteraceae bacterium]|nr:hypothetical protein [Bryobacteraceae bacterium]
MPVLEKSDSFTEQQRLRILAHLDELLATPAFVGSRRRRAFLRYVVEETLAGRGAAIKERNIAVDVFGRSSDFDAHSASIVRVTGGEIRKRLAQAYAAGLNSGVHLELPLGSYQPIFHIDPEVSEEPPAPARDPMSQPAGRSLVRPRQLAALGALAVVLAGAVLLNRLSHRTSSLDRLWQPFLNPDKPVLISLATLNGMFRERSFDDRTGLESPFVGTGGALGAARFAEQLALRRQTFQLKFGSDVSFSDLKSSAAILLGSTRWSDELMRTQRFRIERSEQGKAVVDSQNQGRRWSPPRAPNASEPTEGYSLITRLLSTDTRHPILLVAGLDPRDTQAAVEFLADDRLFEAFSSAAPSDWTRKNFQVVLHNRIFGKSPGSLNVVAFHIW